MTLPERVAGPETAAATAATAAYEQLRAWVTGQSPPGLPPAGLALVLRSGVTTWLAAAPMWLRAVAGPPLRRPLVPALSGPALGRKPASEAADVADVLATMVAAVVTASMPVTAPAGAPRVPEGR